MRWATGSRASPGYREPWRTRCSSFPGGIVGLAMNLEEDEIGCVILGEAAHIEEGSPVKQTGQILSVPVGDGMLGRVVNALGEPVDGKGSIKSEARRPLEVQAPGVTARQPVTEPLQTGIKAVDGMIPIGRGQRQLIIGDRQTGKTAIAIDAIINQRQELGRRRCRSSASTSRSGRRRPPSPR